MDYYYPQDTLLRGSIFESPYLNPAYLFERLVYYIKIVVDIVTSDATRNIFYALLFFFAVFFISIIAYVTIRMFEIRKKEHTHVHHEIHEYAHHKAEYEKRLREEKGGSKNEHWSKTLVYLFSQSSSDWKLAIIEADTMLDGLLTQLGFKGDTLGDKLKSANQNSFPQLTTAWEVHTIRNRIAHEGLSFELTHHEAKRVIALYEQIFHTYGYI